MRIKKIKTGALALLVVTGLVLPASTGAAGEAPREALARHQRQAIAAYQAGNYGAFLAETRSALAIEPGHPRFLYNLACGLALTGAGDEAVHTLGRLAAMGVWFDLAAEEDFAAIGKAPGFTAAVARMDALLQPAGIARRAFTLDDRQFIPEGIAHDPADGAFYVGSVRKREIVRVGSDGRGVRLAGREDGLDAVLGLAVDPARRALWACSSALPEMEGFTAADERRAAVVRIALASNGRAGSAGPVQRFPLPVADGPHTCNDLTLGPGGEVYVADSAGGALYRLALGGAAVEALVPAGTFRSPNGLALAAGGGRLYVSDYPTGLYALDLAGRKGGVTRLAVPEDLVVLGIDGLAAVPGRPATLVAIQNGVRPHRVLRLDLAPDGLAVTGGEVLLRAHPDFDEPTLGTVVGDRFYLVANSHWNRIGADHAPPPAAELTPPVVLELALPAAAAGPEGR